MKYRPRDVFGSLRPHEWAPKDAGSWALPGAVSGATYQGFETPASLRNLKSPGAWLRLKGFAEELRDELRRAEAIRRNPFLNVAPLHLPKVSDDRCKAPLCEGFTYR